MNAKTVEVLQQAMGRIITHLILYCEDDSSGLHVFFGDGTQLNIYDSTSSSSESRYLRTNDDLGYFVGALFLGAEDREIFKVPEGAADRRRDEEVVHEVQFLVVHTSLGSFTIACHNKHNRYYCGFNLQARWEDTDIAGGSGLRQEFPLSMVKYPKTEMGLDIDVCMRQWGEFLMSLRDYRNEEYNDYVPLLCESDREILLQIAQFLFQRMTRGQET